MKAGQKYQACITGLRRRLKQRNEMLEKERLELLRRIRPAGPALKALGAKDVILFGSILERGAFDRASDIDVFVSGLPDEKVWKALGTLERAVAIRERDINIVFEQMGPSGLTEQARRTGMKL